MSLRAGTGCRPHGENPGARLLSRMMLGDIEITALNDGVTALPMDKLLTNVTPEEVNDDLARVYLAVPVETSFNGVSQAGS
jgi:hypothetical protein